MREFTALYILVLPCSTSRLVNSTHGGISNYGPYALARNLRSIPLNSPSITSTLVVSLHRGISKLKGTKASLGVRDGGSQGRVGREGVDRGRNGRVETNWWKR